MDKQYKHSDFEEKIYKLWDKSGGFKPSNTSKKPFTIIMPPPNANDPLHIGHAMFVTVEDVLIRYHRMLGDSTLWLPGTDHAGIETQFVFEKKLKKQGKSRLDYDRDTLYKMIWDYVQENSDVAVDQLKRIGASADWTRFKFTLDPEIVKIVVNTFEKLHKDGLVYRDLRLVNYCTHCGTAFSELEINHKKQTTPLYYIRYPFVDGKGHIVIATTRPEPIFVDTHLAVHPKDKKNKHLIGKAVKNPLTEKRMTIIGDDFVDPEFGTGIVKLTPAHDFNDFEVAKTHDLPIIRAVGDKGKMIGGGILDGMYVTKARKKAVEEIEKRDLLEKIDKDYSNTVAVCYRCGTHIEPMPMPQFFIKVAPLVKPVLSALKHKDVVVHGSGHDKILKHWLKNLKDWNVSRQIVWGIRLPVWYEIVKSKEQRAKSKNYEIAVRFLDENKKLVEGKIGDLLGKFKIEEITAGLQSLRAPMEAKFVVSPTQPGKDYIQETDTFDTWFSSGQWPFATLKSSRVKSDFERFYPTQVMETAYDILIFWVMRMLMLGLYKTGKVPFEQVYLHGLVRDEKGQKMSKSKGNVINPLTVIEKYGADSLRMALVMSTTAGSDSATGEEKIRGMRNLTNKIWNSVRFIIMMDDNLPFEKNERAKHENELKRDHKTNITTVTRRLKNLKVGQAAEWIYHWFWHTYCDRYIELSKRGLVSKNLMIEIVVDNLKLLHPFVPFVTEAAYQELRSKGLVIKDQSETLMSAKWPSVK